MLLICTHFLLLISDKTCVIEETPVICWKIQNPTYFRQNA